MAAGPASPSMAHTGRRACYGPAHCGWPASAAGHLSPIGAAAWPAIRAPWWDRHLIPLPHARLALVYGEPITVPRGAELDPDLCLRVTESLAVAEARAWEIVRGK